MCETAGASAPLVYLGCACSGALAHVACVERAALAATGPTGPRGPEGANPWSVCGRCSERYSGDMWDLLGECWYKNVGGLDENDPWRMLATERHIDCLRIRQSVEEAERVARALLTKYRSIHGVSHERTLAVASLLGLIVGAGGRHDEALGLFELVLGERGGAQSIELLETRAHIARCHLMKGDVERAKKGFLAVAKECEEAFGGSAVSLRMWLMYCDVLQREATPEALKLCEKTLSHVLRLAARGVGADHYVAVRAAYLHSDIRFLTATSDDERRAAMTLMTTAVDSLLRGRGTNTHLVWHAAVRLATRELKASKAAEAGSDLAADLASKALCRLESVLPSMDRVLGGSNDATLQAATTYGDALCWTRNFGEGERVLRRTREVAEASAPLSATRARAAEMHELSLTMLNGTLLHHNALVEVRGFDETDERSAYNGKRGRIIGSPTPKPGGAEYAVMMEGKTPVRMTAENARAACYYPACTTNRLPIAVCAKCQSAAYCCKECQVGHWKTHKALCAVTVGLRARS